MSQELEPTGGSGVQRSDNTLTAPAPMTPGSLVTATTRLTNYCGLPGAAHPDSLGANFFTGAHTDSYFEYCNIASVVCVLLLNLHHGRLVLLNIATRRADRAGDRLLVVCYLSPTMNPPAA